MATNGKFEPLALLVAAGMTVKSAAKQTSTSERTAYRTTATVEFKQRVSELRSEVAAATVGKLTQGAAQAADTLVALLDESSEPSIRLNASKAILASIGGITELGELRARLDALERRA